MGPRQIRLIQVLVLVIAIGAVIGAYLMLNQPKEASESPVVITEWGCEELDALPGQYLDGDGNVVIDCTSWTGDVHNLITTWDSKQDVQDSTHIIKWHFTIQADPGKTISAADIRIYLEEDTRMYFGYDLDEFGYVDATIRYNGKILHNSESDMTVTTDAFGHARMELIILDDGIHWEPWYDGKPLRST